jgi:hypothetical protein
LVEEEGRVAGALVPRSDLERELATLRQQVAEPTRKTVWVGKSQREVELEMELKVVRRELEAVRGNAKGKSSVSSSLPEFLLKSQFAGKGKEVEEVQGKPTKVPASKVVDAEIAEVRARVTEVEREFEALQGEWQGK